MGLNVYTSNRLERLVERLAEIVAKPLPKPLDSEIVVVQSFGMQQWLSLELTRRFNIWTNCHYIFPNMFLKELYQGFIKDMSDDALLFERDVLTWRIMKVLPICLENPNFASINAYLKTDGGVLRVWQLAVQIANVFDQYCIFRPEMVLKWESGHGKGWQADLWRHLTNSVKPDHKARLRKEFFKAIRKPHHEIHITLPSRIAVFGISSLPPFYMSVFAALAEHCEINLFLMNPSQEYWGEIKSDYEIAKETRKKISLQSSVDDLHYEKGNSLLASMGRLGRDFIGLILDYNPCVHEYFEAPARTSLLHHIQHDILTMIDRGGMTDDEVQTILLTKEQITADTSIRINSCHSPMREVEVLHDFLLNLFAHMPDIKPSDILIMTPDIEQYAPFIHAVFDVPEREVQRIPYFVADRTIKHQSILVKKFFSILDLNNSRFTATAVLDILECPAVQRRFNLSPRDLDVIHQWVRETRVSWGIDAEYRSRQGLPAIKYNSWQSGFERLLLGYAMPAKEEQLFQGILPYTNIEGSEAQVLGHFITFANTLFSTVLSIEQSRSLRQWQVALKALLDELFLPDEDEIQDTNALRCTIENLSRYEEQSGYTDEIDRAVITAVLENALREEYVSTKFLTGGVTCCAMLPMRSIPFKVICLLGMNDTAFPRMAQGVSFNLIEQHPRRGDRSVRHEDRYLFLESLVSAREILYISYVGQSIRDNSEMPPSVLVSELLDYIQQGYKVPGANIADFITVKHRLQAFSPHYFEPEGVLYSYSQENCNACMALFEEHRMAKPFIGDDIVCPVAEQNIIKLEEISRFFDHPAKYFLNKTVGLYFEETAELFDDCEPFDLSGLEKYHIGQRLCNQYIENKDDSYLIETIRAAGILPHGNAGTAALHSLIPSLRRFSKIVKSHLCGQPGAVTISLPCDGFTITGTIKNLWSGGLVHYRCARIRARDRLRAWIEHLILNGANDPSLPKKTLLIGTDYVFIADVIAENAWFYLQSFIKAYRRGMQRLLYFYPESSLAYCAALNKGRSREEALNAARRVWQGNDYVPGEGADPYYERCFKNGDPFTEAFEELSQELCEPVIRYQKSAAG